MDIAIHLRIANATGIEGSGGSRGLTEAIGTKVTGVIAPPSIAGPLEARGTDTASPATGRVALVERNVMGPILMWMSVNCVATGPTDAKVAFDRVLPNLRPRMSKGVLERGWGGIRSTPRLDVMDLRAATMGIVTALMHMPPRLPYKLAATGMLAEPLAIGLFVNATGDLMASAASASDAPTV